MTFQTVGSNLQLNLNLNFDTQNNETTQFQLLDGKVSLWAAAVFRLSITDTNQECCASP